MLKRGLIGSGVLHAVIIAAATVVWPHVIEDFAEEEPPVIPVDLVEIAEVSNVKPMAVERRAPDVTAPQQVAVLEPKFQTLAPPPLEEIEVEPEPVKETPPPPEPPVPEPPPKVVEQPPVSAPPVRPAQPRRKPAPEQPKFDVDSVLALLDKRTPKAPPQKGEADNTIKGLGAQTAMTLDLRDALLNQMRECWNVPVGAPNPEKLIVQVRVFLAQDGRLAQPPRLEPGSRAAAALDPYVRTAAEAALRAVSVCEPYKRLPPERYETWREIVMTFDPSKMLGR